MTEVVGIGAGGHARIIIELLQGMADYELVGLTDRDPTHWGSTVMGASILGSDEELPRLRRNGIRTAFLGVGAVNVKGTRLRARLFREVVALGFDVLTVVHPRAIVSPSATLGPGTVVLGGAVIGTGVRVGANATIYSGAVVEHDSMLEDHAHLSPGVQLAGGVAVEEGAFVGIGASIIQGVRVGAWATVGAGAAVLADVPRGAVAVGVPARIVREAGA